MPPKAILDANVLYPFTLRDTLLRAAADGHLQLSWSEQILEEARRNLVDSARITGEQAQRLFDQMIGAFPESMVSGHEPLISAMRNEEKDRHVAAAAVKAAAPIIVTQNLRDFRGDGRSAARTGRRFETAPVSLGELLDGLMKVVPGFAAAVGEFLTSR